MNALSIICLAFPVPARNKTRAALAMPGVNIGVSTVSAMVRIGQGAQGCRTRRD